MTPEVANALRALVVGAGVVAMVASGIALVRAAKRGGRGMHTLGAMLMLAFSWATIRDPYKDHASEVRDEKRRGNSDGDPLDPA